jgi:hypothetical protein
MDIGGDDAFQDRLRRMQEEAERLASAPPPEAEPPPKGEGTYRYVLYSVDNPTSPTIVGKPDDTLQALEATRKRVEAAQLDWKLRLLWLPFQEKRRRAWEKRHGYGRSCPPSAIGGHLTG